MPRPAVWRAFRRSLALLLTALTAGGQAACASPPPKDSAVFKPPCGGSPASSIQFAQPFLYGQPLTPGKFSTSGGKIYIKPDKFVQNGVFDLGDRKITEISVGRLSELPTTPPTSADPSIIRVSLHEREYGPVDLPSGQYWLLSSNIAEVQILSCTPGALTEIPGGPTTSPTPR
jgi:hypothetical protein